MALIAQKTHKQFTNRGSIVRSADDSMVLQKGKRMNVPDPCQTAAHEVETIQSQLQDLQDALANAVGSKVEHPSPRDAAAFRATWRQQRESSGFSR